jgi:hypothetical protein
LLGKVLLALILAEVLMLVEYRLMRSMTVSKNNVDGDALSYWSYPIWSCEVNQGDHRIGNSQSRQVDKCLCNFWKQFAQYDTSVSGPVVSGCASFVAVLASWVAVSVCGLHAQILQNGQAAHFTKSLCDP